MCGKKNKGKVFFGLSGGVDSAVSAALLQQQGYEVTGVFIRIVIPGYPCTAGADKIEAMRVAAHLDIPFLELDLSKEYGKQVFRPSIGEFKEGKTPNPDVLCNREIKFGKFFEFARSCGADLIATGHYARLVSEKLFTGADSEKDQSYFLWAVPETVLRYTLFPVGNLKKTHVRALARRFGLPNAARKDSQGLCFLGPISMQDMLTHELSPKPGNVLDEAGVIIGSHQGTLLYTLGERHGFVLFAQTPEMPPHFVIAKDIAQNTITVSTSRFPRDASKTRIMLRDCNWIGVVPSRRYQARFRYRQTLIPAELDRSDFRGSQTCPTITLLEPHYVPMGQSLVLYDSTRCLGGGIVADTEIF